MAKKSIKARELKRSKTADQFREKREKIKAIIKDRSVSFEERMEAQTALQKLPRNASPARKQRRCGLCGRPHAVYRKVGLCRIHFRQALNDGHVPGGRKASW